HGWLLALPGLPAAPQRASIDRGAELAARGLWPLDPDGPRFPAVLRLTAYLAGDGNLNPNRRRLDLYTSEVEDAADLANDLRLLASLGFNAMVTASGRRGEIRDHVVTLRGGEAEQLRFLREVGFCRAVVKRRAAAEVLICALQRAETLGRRAAAVREAMARKAAGETVRDVVAGVSAAHGAPASLV